MQVSRRIAALKPSATVSLNAKANQLAKAGTKVFNFSVGEPDFDTPKPIVDRAVEAMRKGRTKYGTAGGGLELRQAIAHKFKRDNQLTFEPENIVVGIGAKEILFHAALALLNEGDEVLIPAPYWVSYTAHVEAAGAQAICPPMAADFSKKRMDPTYLEKFATSKTKMFIYNSPNNPSGYVLRRDELMALGEYLKKKDWWIVSDEMYEYLSFSQPHLSLLQLFPELRERFLLVHGMSKCYAMTGWRVGFACGPSQAIKPITNLQSQSSTCLPGFIEDAATFALHEGPGLLAREFADLKARRDLAAELLGKISGLTWIDPEGAFYIFMDMRPLFKKTTRYGDSDSLKFSSDLLEKYHVAMVPGEAFGAPGYIRLSYATSTQILRDGIARFSEAVRDLLT